MAITGLSDGPASPGLRPKGDTNFSLKTFSFIGFHSIRFRKARDVKFMQRAQKKYFMKLGVKANKLQRHFVDPTL